MKGKMVLGGLAVLLIVCGVVTTFGWRVYVSWLAFVHPETYDPALIARGEALLRCMGWPVVIVIVVLFFIIGGLSDGR